MSGHPFDISDPSSADGPAVDATPSLTADPHGPDRDDAGVEGLLGEIRARQEKAQPIVGHWMLSSSTIALGRLDTYAVCLSQMDARALLALVDESRAKVAALTIDRDEARAAMYRAQGAMLRMRDRCDALRAEVGATFKKLCDAATLAGVRERERDEARAEVGALTKERDALKVELAASDAVGKAQLVETMEAETRLAFVLSEVRRYVDLDCCSDATCDVCGILRGLIGETGKEAIGDT